MTETKMFSISNDAIIRIIFFALLLVFLYLIRDILAIVFLSIVIASAVRPASVWFEKYFIPRVVSVIIVYLAAFIVLGVVFYLVVPPLVYEVSNFLSSEKESFRELPAKIFPVLYEKIKSPGSFSGVLNGFSSSLKTFVPGFTGGFFGAVASIFGGFTSFVLTVVLSFYLSVQEKGIEHFLRIITPGKHESYVLGLWERAQNKISKWLRGQLLLGVLIGVLVFLGLTLLGVKYALSLAIIAALFELIPVFGPILASIPAIIMGLIQAPWLGVSVLVFYVLIQQFENHLIYPFVMKKVIGIPPIIAILALLIGAKLAGFFGILLSVPVAVVVMEILNDVAAKKKIII